MASETKNKKPIEQREVDRQKIKRKKIEPQTGGSRVIKPTQKEAGGNADQ